jgi:hypothetical protein
MHRMVFDIEARELTYSQAHPLKFFCKKFKMKQILQSCYENGGKEVSCTVRHYRQL